MKNLNLPIQKEIDEICGQEVEYRISELNQVKSNPFLEMIFLKKFVIDLRNILFIIRQEKKL